jgi:uncharacterized protein (TIGR02453 family)
MLTHHSHQFLKNLELNNNREWFHANRKDYNQAKEDFESLCQMVLAEISKFQENLLNTSVKSCIFRINRDLRFSVEKSPYKNHLSAAFGPGGRKSGKVDFYLHIQPNEKSFLGGGMWFPTSTQLTIFRQEIDYSPNRLKKIIEEKYFKNYFNEIHGEKLKKTPQGYSAEHPDIELLKYKELFFIHRFTDEETLNKNFVSDVVNGCRLLKPYLEYLNNLFYIEIN